MKKLLYIIITLLICTNLFAFSEQDAKNDYFKGRNLEKIEGIWIDNNSTIFAIYKQGSQYIQKIISSPDNVHYSGQETGTYSGSSLVFYGPSYFTLTSQTLTGFWQDKVVTKKTPISCNATLALLSFYKFKWNCQSNSAGSAERTASKIWPASASQSQTSAKKSKSKRGGAGTAFFITSEGHLLTNNHVVEVCSNNSKIVINKVETPVKVIAKDELLDLALLKADLKKTDYIILSDDPPKKLQRIIAAGYPLGKSLSDDLKFTSGIISSLKGLNDDSTLIQIDAALNKGNSGGPIVDEESGELVGIAVAGLRKDKTEAVNFGIKTNSVRNFLDANQIKAPTSKLLFSFGSTDVSQILEKATAYTYCK
tara:strand:- start:276 stop:1376 length:1101 start_codon:yes stop_codon:yes gene_type:complete